MDRTVFKDFRNRVDFISYENILKQYELMCAVQKINGVI